MLRLTITFLVIAIIAAILGFGGIAGAAAGIAEILFYIFIVLFLLSLIFGRRRVLCNQSLRSRLLNNLSSRLFTSANLLCYVCVRFTCRFHSRMI